MGENLGQHFLDDKNVLADIITAGELSSEDIVLEVGPGEGVLTQELLKKARRVVAVEKDPALARELQARFKKEIADGSLEVVPADIRDLDIANNLKAMSYKLVANIPYYLTGQLFQQVLTAENQPKVVVLLVQKEVAERIIATDGKESILSLSVKVFGAPEIIRTVDRKSFTPPPKVDSAILKISDISRSFFKDIDESEFFALIKRGFAHKRKTLANNLATDPRFNKERVETALENIDTKKNIRAEKLGLQEWKSLYENLGS
jgi:16S rRNA (adenine1518-N6/adenine1519-N6)-dimethyltransferase